MLHGYIHIFHLQDLVFTETILVMYLGILSNMESEAVDIGFAC